MYYDTLLGILKRRNFRTYTIQSKIVQSKKYWLFYLFQNTVTCSVIISKTLALNF